MHLFYFLKQKKMEVILFIKIVYIVLSVVFYIEALDVLQHFSDRVALALLLIGFYILIF